MSTPVRCSGRNGDAAASEGYGTTGRRFAKRPSARRIPSSPCSGRILALDESHRGPPTAPRSTASASRQSAIVSLGSGSPVASIAAPPINASQKVNEWLKRSATASSTVRAAATTSGPTPSPGSVTIVAPEAPPDALTRSPPKRASRCEVGERLRTPLPRHPSREGSRARRRRAASNAWRMVQSGTAPPRHPA